MGHHSRESHRSSRDKKSKRSNREMSDKREKKRHKSRDSKECREIPVKSRKKHNSLKSKTRRIDRRETSSSVESYKFSDHSADEDKEYLEFIDEKGKGKKCQQLELKKSNDSFLSSNLPISNDNSTTEKADMKFSKNKKIKMNIPGLDKYKEKKVESIVKKEWIPVEKDEKKISKNNTHISMLFSKKKKPVNEYSSFKQITRPKMFQQDVFKKRKMALSKWRDNITKTIPKVNLLDDNIDQVVVAEDEDDVDPLDVYMEDIKSQLVKTQGDNGWLQKVVKIDASHKVEDGESKGEIMEKNTDLLIFDDEPDAEEELKKQLQELNKKKRELTAADHSRIYYAPFRKNLYIEVPELTRITEEELKAIREELGNIKIRGTDCPKPIRNWAQCGVSSKILKVLKRNNFVEPTPIQAQAIPVIMSGRDLIGIAKTGSGKTLAFVLPLLRHVMDQSQLDDMDGPIAIIMAPTRELALQITREVKRFTVGVGIRVVCVYGGTGISDQISDLKRGAEILVFTPGRMIDMLSANGGRVTNLRRCTYVVLDEADRMFDMGFEPQVMRIISNIRPDRQTVLFSATFPRSMEIMARKILNKPIEVQVGGRSVVCSDVMQSVIIISETKKFLKLLELIGKYQDDGQALVFVDTQEGADSIVKQLMKFSHCAMALHAGVDQYDRDSILGFFRNNEIPILVATSVAARGLDVKNIIIVINYDAPNHYEDYVHRCGRTGRAGNTGYAYTFVGEDQGNLANNIIKALQLSDNPVPPKLKTLWTDYVKRQEVLGEKVHSSGGFGGKGFKFDDAEAYATETQRTLQKAALGNADSGDDADEQIEKKIEHLFNSSKSVSTRRKYLPESKIVKGAAANKLQLAKEIASGIKIKAIDQDELAVDSESVMDATQAVLLGNAIDPSVSSKSVAEKIADKFHEKIGYIPEKIATPMKEETEIYYEEIEINDFPQHVRWKVTSKDSIFNVCEVTAVGITVRGAFCPSNKDTKDGERRLHLVIESDNGRSMEKAKRMIVEIIRTEMLKAAACVQPFRGSRYNVL